MSNRRGMRLTALAVCGAVVGCGGWVDLERPDSGAAGSAGSGGTSSKTSGATGGIGGSSEAGKTTDPVTGAGKANGGSDNPTGREDGGQPDGASSGGAPSGDCRTATTCFEALDAPAPGLVPAGAEAASFEANVTITTGDLQAGVLAGYTEYCFKLSPKNQTCDFKTHEPFVWTEQGGLMPLDRLQQLGGVWFYPGQVSADGRTVVGTFASSSDPPGDAYRLFRWTKADGGQLLGEPAEAFSQFTQFLSRDGSVTAGMFKLGGKGATGHIAFVWSPSLGFMRLDAFQSWRGNSDLMAMNEDGTAFIAQSYNDPTEVFRYELAVSPQLLGHLPEFDRCTFAGASSDLSSVFGSCTDSNGTMSGFRWTKPTGMIALPAPSGTQSCSFSPAIVNDTGTIVFGYLSCGTPSAQLARWTVDGGVEALPGVSGSFFGLSASRDGAVAFGVTQDVAAIGGEPPPPGQVPTAPPDHAFRWDMSHGAAELAPLPGDPSATPLATDSHGRVIVGYSGMRDAQTGRAAWWTESGVAEIAGLLEARGISLGGVHLDITERVAVDDRGVLLQGSGSSGAWIARLPSPPAR